MTQNWVEQCVCVYMHTYTYIPVYSQENKHTYIITLDIHKTPVNNYNIFILENRNQNEDTIIIHLSVVY